MSNSEPSRPAAITLEQLIALNDEIAALIRAGVPLEQGLGHLGRDLRGRLGRVTQDLAKRMQRGESLADVLDERSGSFPPVYRAVVEAGLESGRLAAALESVASSARRLAETRRVVLAGSLYPLLVFLLAWGLFVFFVGWIAPELAIGLEAFRAPGYELMALLVSLGNMTYSWGQWRCSAIQFWGPLVPLVVVVLTAFWWDRSARATLLQPRAGAALLGWLPLIGRMLQSFRVATFSEVLALLVESRVPLDRGLVLAARASGDQKMLRSAEEMAAALRRGDSLDSGQEGQSGFPPLLDWLMRSGQRRGTLLKALRHASETYHRRAWGQAQVIRIFLPALMTVVIAGGVSVLYTLIIFGPWASLLRTTMAAPI